MYLNQSLGCLWRNLNHDGFSPEHRSIVFTLHRYRILYLITLFTGLREGEILGLSWDCVDWDNHILTIRQQLQKNREKKEYCIETPKNSKTRRIVVADAVMGLLQEQYELQSQLKSHAGKAWQNNTVGSAVVLIMLCSKRASMSTSSSGAMGVLTASSSLLNSPG